MDYSKLSDDDINLLVAKILGVTINGDGEPVTYREADYGSYGDFLEESFDPCNNWADAGKVITEHFIQLDPQINSCCEECSDSYYTGNWEASYFDTDTRKTFYSISENPLRATMIVFLMMQES